MKENNFCICPNDNCINIPEISYSYDPFNPIVKYKCTIHTSGNDGEVIALDEFLKNSSKNIHCSICHFQIISDNYIYCQKCKKILDRACYEKSGCSIERQSILVNENSLFNCCLKHNKNFIFHCINCNVSLCSLCDFEFHNDKKHIIQQIITTQKNQNDIDNICISIKKLRYYINKIKDMNNKLIQILEDDVIIKEKIMKNYENNNRNYQSILNFNNLDIKNNEKYEIILDDIINQFNEFEKNENNKFNEKIIINTILSPLYFSIMVNKNHDFNYNLINKINNEILNNCKYNKSLEINNEILNNCKIDKFLEVDSRYNKGIKIKNNFDDNNNNKKIKIDTKNEDSFKINKHIEIKKFQHINSIINMIILHSGNIALGSNNSVTIYNGNNLCSENETDCILQRINIYRSRKVKYIFEFPDQTLLCSITGRILRFKLIDNDKRYNILGVIRLENFEETTKLISLGDSYLVALTELKRNCFLKLFIKDKNNIEEKEYNSFDDVQNDIYNSDDDKIDNKESDNFDNQSAGVLSDYYDYINAKKIQIDKEFYPYSKKKSINADRKLLCSILEIKKKHNNKLYENEFEFIATSNSTYSYGDNRLEFYKIDKTTDDNIRINRIKLINDISCSTEADSTCQINHKFIIVGLENFNHAKQINGFALIDVYKREICKIINDLPVSTICYNTEKKLLFSALDLVEIGNKHTNIIKIYELIEGINDVNFKEIYNFKSEHKDIIVTLLNLKNINDENNIFVASSSLDSTLRITKLMEK